MTLEEFKAKFVRLKHKGYVRSQRKGPTGVGHTLEVELGLDENNIAEPDLEKVELKAHRTTSHNLITLFTFNRKAWQIPPLEAIKKYGSLDKNDRLGLYYTMSLKPNSAGLFLNVTDDMIQIQHISGEVIARWMIDAIAERFRTKIPAMIFVSAFNEKRDGIEYFHYYRAQLLQDTSPDVLANQFREENILLDLRLHDRGTRARNHGTAFRAYENKLPTLFRKIEEID